MNVECGYDVSVGYVQLSFNHSKQQHPWACIRPETLLGSASRDNTAFSESQRHDVENGRPNNADIHTL
jgi:hypothetical protein